MKLAALLFLFLGTSLCHAADLTIAQSGERRLISTADLYQLKALSVTIQDPVYKKIKHYYAYRLLDLLHLADVHLSEDSVIVFTALDGYKTRISARDMKASQAAAFIAVKDLDAPGGWEMVHQGKEWLSPGPYYLVWQVNGPIPPAIELPWPYEIKEISVHKGDSAQEKLFPSSAEKTPSVIRGYRIFRQNCLNCHSLNLEGGAIGPELNVPQNILEYENPGFLKKFIQNPSAFRARSKMPAFGAVLDSASIDDLLHYLAWMAGHKITAHQ